VHANAAAPALFALASSTVLPLPPHHIGAPLDAAVAPRFAASNSMVLLLLLPISPSPLLPANPLSPRIKFAFFSFEGEEEVLKCNCVKSGHARAKAGAAPASAPTKPEYTIFG
jgi:hypothetical protein